MHSDGPAGGAADHKNVLLRPVEEADLGLLVRFDSEADLPEPYEWKGFRDPRLRLRRWEQDGYLGIVDSVLVVALPDGAFAGFVGLTAVRRAAPIAAVNVYRIGIGLLPEYRNRGLGSAAQCLLADHIFWTTLANRVEAGTDLENLVEQRALEKAGFQREGVARGAGYSEGRIRDGVIYARPRSDPHP
ncbi:MAG TPA: GNAT family protein [Acidimicrobiales bacterium]|nr:GNAT family protein [Acidimicrobiales bacterium]